MLNPLAHKVPDISLATITDGTENYAQALSTYRHTHTKNTQTIQISPKVEGHIPALRNKKVSPVTNYDTNSL